MDNLGHGDARQPRVRLQLVQDGDVETVQVWLMHDSVAIYRLDA
jgi:hypothetical protein